MIQYNIVDSFTHSDKNNISLNQRYSKLETIFLIIYLYII
jgi:hypothetical protein